MQLLLLLSTKTTTTGNFKAWFALAISQKLSLYTEHTVFFSLVHSSFLEVLNQLGSQKPEANATDQPERGLLYLSSKSLVLSCRYTSLHAWLMRRKVISHPGWNLLKITDIALKWNNRKNRETGLIIIKTINLVIFWLRYMAKFLSKNMCAFIVHRSNVLKKSLKNLLPFIYS